MAERVGFEPTVPFGITGFQDQLLKPLGHLSKLNYYLNILPCFVQQIKPLPQLSAETYRKSCNPPIYFIKVFFVLSAKTGYN